MRKRTLSLLLALVLVLGALPQRVAAEELPSVSPSEEEPLVPASAETEAGERITEVPNQEPAASVENETISVPDDMQLTAETAPEPESEQEPKSEPETEPEKESEPVTVSNDVNSDGTFDLNDVIMLSQYLVGFDVTIDVTAADVDEDEIISIIDLILMKQHLAG